MPHNRPLKFRVAGRQEFLKPAILVSIMVLISALASPRPIAMTIAVGLLLGAGWVLFNFKYSETTDVQPTLVILPDGLIKMKSNGNLNIEGVFGGQQWCNSQFSVLRIVTANKQHCVVLFSAQQNATDYRRLMVWLRQDLLLKNEERVKS